MDISDTKLKKEELEQLAKLSEVGAYVILKRMCLARMELLKEDAIFDVGQDPHGAGLRQGEYQVLATFLTLPEDSYNKLMETKEEESK